MSWTVQLKSDKMVDLKLLDVKCRSPTEGRVLGTQHLCPGRKSSADVLPSCRQDLLSHVVISTDKAEHKQAAYSKRREGLNKTQASLLPQRPKKKEGVRIGGCLGLTWMPSAHFTNFVSLGLSMEARTKERGILILASTSLEIFS